MPELSLPTAGRSPARQRPSGGASVRERERRAEALRRHQADARVHAVADAGEVAYLRAQLRVAAQLTARLAALHAVEEMARLVVEELHGTFAFYLAAIQRLDHRAGMLRLLASAGPLAEVMTEFLLLEQPVHVGVNGRVARSGTTALVPDTPPTGTTCRATRTPTPARS